MPHLLDLPWNLAVTELVSALGEGVLSLLVVVLVAHVPLLVIAAPEECLVLLPEADVSSKSELSLDGGPQVEVHSPALSKTETLLWQASMTV